MDATAEIDMKPALGSTPCQGASTAVRVALDLLFARRLESREKDAILGRIRAWRAAAVVRPQKVLEGVLERVQLRVRKLEHFGVRLGALSKLVHHTGLDVHGERRDHVLALDVPEAVERAAGGRADLPVVLLDLELAVVARHLRGCRTAAAR